MGYPTTPLCCPSSRRFFLEKAYRWFLLKGHIERSRCGLSELTLLLRNIAWWTLKLPTFFSGTSHTWEACWRRRTVCSRPLSQAASQCSRSLESYQNRKPSLQGPIFQIPLKVEATSRGPSGLCIYSHLGVDNSMILNRIIAYSLHNP